MFDNRRYSYEEMGLYASGIYLRQSETNQNSRGG